MGPRLTRNIGFRGAPKAGATERGRRRAANVTAEDVARKLGLSQSTISRAFTVSASISAATKARVMTAAAALGYQPNVIARSLMTRRTNIVAIVMANLIDPFYPVVLDHLTQHIQALGRQTLLFVPSAGQDVEDILPTLLQYQVDGIVITSATPSSTMARTCAARQTPVVLFNRYVPGLKIPAVSCDNVAGGRRIADYLVAGGHVRLAFVSGQPDATTNLDRQHGFGSRLRELGITTCLHEPGGDYSYEAGFAAARRLAQRKRRPDAIFFASDVMAFGGMDALREQGLRIPHDVSVVGFDDVPSAAWPCHALTTLRQPVAAMVDAAIETLDLDGRSAARRRPNTRVIMGELIERMSSAARDRARQDGIARNALGGQVKTVKPSLA
jgi:DNA-binding LacI/PurR family transcriptional regulator